MSDTPSMNKLGIFIGELAVKHNMIEPEDLKKALKACAGFETQEEAIPEYLMAQDLISEKDYKKLSAIAKATLTRHLDIKFGNMAVQRGYITEPIMKLALDEQSSLFKSKKKYTLLGDILVDAGMMTPGHRDEILKEQNRYQQSRDDMGEEDESTGKGPPPGKESRPDGEADHPSSRDGEDSSQAKTVPHKNFAFSEVFPLGIKLVVQPDGNAAFLSKTYDFKKDITIGQIKEILASKNILHGVADNKKIQHFIDSDIFYKKPFVIARGNAPEPTQNATVKYLFAGQRLKAGTIREDGTIDFRERGEIPQVEKGTVLAVKKDAVEGKVGKNIFNDTIRVTPARDIRLKAGRGARLSEDGLRVIADVSGHPKLARDGTVIVYDSYIVKGNVDYETGNIDYQGDVIVTGCIQNGFRVKANNVKAQSLDGAVVIAQGNVTVDQGITESKISARGTLKAKFIQTSSISCLGDVSTQKEVVESSIECSGICTIDGVLISSSVSAKMGLYARQIGMEKASPNTVRVGFDIFAEKEAQVVEKRLGEIKLEEKRMQDVIAEAFKKMNSAEARMQRMSEAKDKNDEERMNLIYMISSENGDSGEQTDKSKQMEAELQRFTKSGEEINSAIVECRQIIKDMNEKILETEQIIQ
ncbi:MAG: DUF342 domain-containing protein, partial [Desulfamplus sp.]|nr:DUF342 domain-containing protein [Desulfamplus sp.]